MTIVLYYDAHCVYFIAARCRKYGSTTAAYIIWHSELRNKHCVVAMLVDALLYCSYFKWFHLNDIILFYACRRDICASDQWKRASLQIRQHKRRIDSGRSVTHSKRNALSSKQRCDFVHSIVRMTREHVQHNHNNMCSIEFHRHFIGASKRRYSRWYRSMKASMNNLTDLSYNRTNLKDTHFT